MKKLFTLLLAVAASVGTMFAWDYERVQIGDLYYNLNATSQTAEVTSQNSRYPFWSTTITTAIIPASVEYNSVTYSVTSIGASAFYNCSSLTSVTIPNSVTSIGGDAFAYCTSLTSVTIPGSVTSIGNSAFSGCSRLTSIIVENGNSFYDSRNNCNAIIETATNTLIVGCKNTIIPNSVTSIGWDAFRGCSGLTSVTIPNSVTSIGDQAFRDCTGLTSVTIGNSVTSIGEGAFYGCTSLTSIEIPNSVTSIGYGAFAYCDGLTSITIPNSVTSIGEGAFGNCSGLTSVTIPNSVTSIGEYAFAECTGLTSVTIGNSVTSIGEGAFYGCTSLTSITIPNSVTSIGEGAFYGCTSLTSIEIPNSVISIGRFAFYGCSGLTSPVYNAHVFAYMPTSYSGAYTIPDGIESIAGGAFYGCSGLTSVTCEAITPPTLGSYVFYDVNKSIPLYVPAESIDLYKTADQWKDFTNIIGLSNIRYIDPSNNELGSETVSLHLPDVPEIEGFTFLKWQVVAGDLEEGIIIQAVYQTDESTSASSVYTNPANPAQKLIRNGNVYILSNEKTYSITGQEVIVP